jgi:hypothetical protein
MRPAVAPSKECAAGFTARESRPFFHSKNPVFATPPQVPTCAAAIHLGGYSIAQQQSTRKILSRLGFLKYHLGPEAAVASRQVQPPEKSKNGIVGRSAVAQSEEGLEPCV